MTCRKNAVMFTLSLATACSVNAFAFPQNNNRSTPPPEAFTACEGKSAGERAMFIGRKGNPVPGICELQRDGRLLLRPDHLRRQGDKPPAAYRDCIGKKLGDAVRAVTPDGRTITGTCEQDGNRLFLRLGNMQQQGRPENTQSGSMQQQRRPENTQSGNRQQQRQSENTRSGSMQQQRRPENTQSGNRQQQVPEELPSTYTACDGKKAGDAARLVDQYGQTITGTCESNGKRLFLRPDDSPAQTAEGIQPKSKPAKQPQKVVPPKSKPKEKPEGLFARLKKFLGGVVDSL